MDENNEKKQDTNVTETTNTPVEETKETKKEVKSEEKEPTNNTNLKKEAKEAKNFFANLFNTPFTAIQKVVSSPKSFLKITIIILVAWVIFTCLGSIISIAKSYTYSPYYTFSMFMRNSIADFFEIFIAILIPVASVAILSVIIYLLMKDKKKNYLTIAATIIIAKVPVVIASLLSLLGYINNQVKVITNSFADFCSVVSIALIYLAIKALYKEEDDNKASKTFLITMAIYFAAVLILRFFNIDIYC